MNTRIFVALTGALLLAHQPVAQTALLEKGGTGPSQTGNPGYGSEQGRLERQQAVAEFESWTKRYAAASGAHSRSRLLAEGLSLAKTRRVALRELIQSDPRRALTAEIPASVRKQVPAEIAGELEVPVSGIGDFLVLCAIPPKGGREAEPIRRLVRLDGHTFRAFVYGRRLGETTKYRIPIHGVAIDGVLALHEGALSELEPAEHSRLTGQVIDLKRVLVVRVDFSDLPGDTRAAGSSEPLTASSAQTLADNQISAFYQNSSYGKSSVAITVTPQLYRLRQSAVYYATVGFEFELYADAQAAAKADYDLADYDVVVVLFTWLGGLPCSQIQFGGESLLGTSMVCVNGEFDFRVVAHELGHAFGLCHANFWQTRDGTPISDNGSSIEYGDPFDTMGANRGNDPRTDFNPWFKYQLNWISDDQVQTITTNGTYRVWRFDDSGATGTLALKIVKDASRNYWVACRRNFTENSTMQRGAYLFWGYDWPCQSDLLGAGATANNARDAALVIDEALADGKANLTIMPVARAGEAPSEYLDVQVTFGPPPMITAQPQAQLVIEGQEALFTVVAAGDPAPNFIWQRQVSGTSAWATLSDGPGYGGSGTPTLRVRETSVLMDGESFRCVLTNSAGGFNCSHPALLSVTRFGVTTFAGQPGLAGQEDGLGSFARFSSPMGIAIDCAGNAYIADTGNHLIRKITPDGIVTTWAGLAGNAGSADGLGGNARFNFPVGIAADMEGNVYVADQNNSTVRKITRDGSVTTLAGSAGCPGGRDGIGTDAQFNHPSGIAVDCFGNVYVADAGNQTVRQITLDNQVTTLAGLAGAAGAIDGLGSDARFSSPIGIAADTAENIYVADQQNSTIRKITREGQATTFAGAAGLPGSADGIGNDARFAYPAGLAVDPAGNVYVADRNNSTIRRITPEGLVSTLAGAVGVEGVRNGARSDAQFSFPTALAVSAQGTVFVADTFAHTIRLVQSAAPLLPSLRMSLVAGQLILSWPASATGFSLEKTGPLSAGHPWIPVTSPTGVSGCSLIVTNDLDAPAGLFRLRKQ